MPLDLTNLQVLAGPIVRRVDLQGATVWVALNKAAQVTVRLWDSPGDMPAPDPGAPPTPAPVAEGTLKTRRLGANLHVAAVTTRLGATPFKLDGRYAYDVVIQVPNATSQNLKSLKLLEDRDLGGFKHLALGYDTNILPAFAFPPSLVNRVKIAHASCRKPHDFGPDALAHLDGLNKPERFHHLILTGDQIYADDVGWSVLSVLNQIGNSLRGGAAEEFRFGALPAAFPVTMAKFPTGLRQRLVVEEAKFTSDAADNHALSFAEYAALYVLCWSNECWPSTLSDKEEDLGILPEDPSGLPPQVRMDLDEQIAGKVKDCTHNEGRPKSLEDVRKRRLDKHRREAPIIKDFLRDLGKVRRLLANVPTLMIFDDHDVTDDWYISRKWKQSVLSSATGRQIVRNGLIAYGFFQGWGNDPAAFAAPANTFLAGAEAALAFDTPGDGVDDLLGLLRPGDHARMVWHYRLAPDTLPYGILVFDERTRRGYDSDLAPPARIQADTIDVQVGAVGAAGRDVLFVVAAGPVLGVSVIEDVFQGAADHGFEFSLHPRREIYKADVEAWSTHPEAFERLLEQLAPARRVVFLSGDVHFGFTNVLSYWPKGEPPAAGFVQFTTSAVKNQVDPEWIKELIRALGLGQRILRSFGPPGRLGWFERTTELPLAFPASAPFASLPAQLRAKFFRTPIVVPALVFPKGTTFNRPVDLAWILEPVIDAREKTEDRPALPGALKTPAAPPFPLDKFPEAAKHHSEAMRKTGLSRQHVFAHNVAVVTIEGVAGGPFSAKQTLYSTRFSVPTELGPLTEHEVQIDPPPTQQPPGLEVRP